ncbi:MAG: ANTAR domain-containing response regulator [Christensenellales bacterium]|jgi:AmiR/NasT family two-component response regulator
MDIYQRGIIIAAPLSVGDALCGILSAARHDVLFVCAKGREAIRRVQTSQPAILIVTCKLEDMPGIEVANAAYSTSNVIMLGSQSELENIRQTAADIILLDFNSPPGIILQTIDVIFSMRSSMNRLEKQISELTRSLEETKIICKAKCALMEARGMSEVETHRRLQTLSMERGERMASVAGRILEELSGE